MSLTDTAILSWLAMSPRRIIATEGQNTNRSRANVFRAFVFDVALPSIARAGISLGRGKRVPRISDVLDLPRANTGQDR